MQVIISASICKIARMAAMNIFIAPCIYLVHNYYCKTNFAHILFRLPLHTTKHIEVLPCTKLEISFQLRLKNSYAYVYFPVESFIRYDLNRFISFLIQYFTIATKILTHKGVRIFMNDFLRLQINNFEYIS